MDKGGAAQYKKVRKEGGSIVLSVGSLLPTDWKVVKIIPLKDESDVVTIENHFLSSDYRLVAIVKVA